jgi:hypothetical protein
MLTGLRPSRGVSMSKAPTKGTWQSTHNYDADNLLMLAKLADQAHSKILKLKTAEAAA